MGGGGGGDFWRGLVLFLDGVMFVYGSQDVETTREKESEKREIHKEK